jgi:hypothetical protein
MAEVGAPNRIARGFFSRLENGVFLRKRSDRGDVLAAIVLEGVIPDDNLDPRVAELTLPVIGVQNEALVVPTGRVSAMLAKRGQATGDRSLEWEASRLGANPDSALIVPIGRLSVASRCRYGLI